MKKFFNSIRDNIGLIFFLSMFVGACFLIGSVSSNEIEVSIVIDGDTFITDEGEHIRIYGIDCPERNQPFGPQARDFTYNHVQRTITIDRKGKDKYGRTIASVETRERRDLAKLLVSNGLAWVYKPYSTPEMYDLMLQARASKVGLWSQYSEPPFKYREEHEKNN